MNQIADANATVTITLPNELADKAQNDISDFLCWVSGYNAGARPEGDGYPFDIDAIREINIQLKRKVK